MTKVEQKSFRNDSKVEQKPFKSDDSFIPEEITMDESNNSLRLFLSGDDTLSVLRIFVHSVSCHFSCQKLCN